MKRYQVYLNPQSVSVLDEVSEISSLTRSKLIKEVVEAAAARIGNLLAVIKPPKMRSYSQWDKMIGSIKVKDKKTVNISENIDEIYYR